MGFLIVPAVGLIRLLSLKMTNDCDNRGATIQDANWFVPQRFCARCGAKLADHNPLRGDDDFLE